MSSIDSLAGLLAQPRETPLTKPLTRIRGVRLEQPSQQHRQLRRAVTLASLLFWTPQQLVGVAEYSLPAQFADPVDHLGRSGPHQRKVPPVNDAIDCLSADVSDDRLKRRQVAVDIGDDRQSHNPRLTGKPSPPTEDLPLGSDVTDPRAASH